MSKLPTTVSTCTDLSDLAPPAKVLVVFETNCVASGQPEAEKAHLPKWSSTELTLKLASNRKVCADNTWIRRLVHV